MVSVDVDVSQLSNAELASMLRKHGVDCGPVVGKLALIVTFAYDVSGCCFDNVHIS